MLSGVLELFSRYAVILIATKPFGYVGVCSADAAAWLTTGILLIVTYMIWKHRVKKQLNAENATINYSSMSEKGSVTAPFLFYLISCSGQKV